MLEIVTQALRFLKDVLLWWIKTVGGPLVAVVQLVYPLKYQTWPPGMTWVLFGLLGFSRRFWRGANNIGEPRAKTVG
ncbi:MAG: hypothetical protein DME86_08570 [Verrucomicrobia bacterium]|nr:MAG: hypothetical protein DME86_08570 [Verrucomicrobiota bacterium]